MQRYMRDIRFILKTKYSNSHALVIGINEYAKASPLSYAVSDAQGVQDALVNELGFPSDNVTLLLDSEATKEKILRAYLAFASESIELDDRVLVYFAGHGHTRTGIRGEVGYLIPHDGNIDDLTTLIRWEDLTLNAELIRAKHMLFIMDACYGGLAINRNLAPGSARFLKDMLLRYSRQVLTAGKADEVVADSGGPQPDHSVFTGHLLDGLAGKAATEDGVMTASGLMSYVYGKVATDKNSRQTPHYGSFDGDGDFILRAPQLKELEADENKDLDTLLIIPFADEQLSVTTTEQKINKIKLLLSADSSSIELHDFIVDEVRSFLCKSNEDCFKLDGHFSVEELQDRIAKYEEVAKDISMLTACIAYWGTRSHQIILRKAISRSTDRLESRNGLSVWIKLRWYPLILNLYSSGIASIEGCRFDSLANIFLAPVGTSHQGRADCMFVESASNAILEFTRAELFKKLPGHERYYAPMSEYLFKILQPQLDDLLFLGTNYESTFDEFEALLALVTADLKKQRDEFIGGPFGRFGWKQHGDASPLSRLIGEALGAGDEWPPLKAGLFGGRIERFNEVAGEYLALVKKLGWR